MGEARLASCPTLARWGVSAHADLVYRALTAFGPQSRVELARSLKIGERPVQAALDELLGFGSALVARDADRARVRVWRGRPPESVVRILRDRQAHIAKARHQLERRLSTLDVVGTPIDWRAARPIYGVGAVRSRVAELVTAERWEHLSMNPEPAFSATSAKAGVPILRAALQRGVATRTLGVPVAAEDESEAHTTDLYEYDLEYRELPQQPIKLMVMDRATVFLPLDPAANFTQGVWELTEPSLVDRVVSFFLRQWSTATAPADRGWIPPAALSHREQAIFRLLATGATDAVVAARLNLSVRTVAYALEDVMDRYGARTRFQLGLLLGAQIDENRQHT